MLISLYSKRGLVLEVFVYIDNHELSVVNSITGRNMKRHGTLKDGYVIYKGVKYYTKTIDSIF